MSANNINVFEFAKREDAKNGVVAVDQFARLVAECADSSGDVNWSVRGWRDSLGYFRLTLIVSATLMMVCQRCMQVFPLSLSSESNLLLAKNEEQADEIEEIIQDDSVDVVVGEESMDLWALIEDEVLLSFPLSIKHDVCPDSSVLDGLKSEKVSPFAILKKK